LPDLLKTFQELINQREPGDIIIPKSVYDQNDTDSMISIGKNYSERIKKMIFKTNKGRVVNPLITPDILFSIMLLKLT